MSETMINVERENETSPSEEEGETSGKCECPTTDENVSILGQSDSSDDKRNAGRADEIIITDPEERPEILETIFDYINDNVEKYVEALTEAVGIRSVSAWPSARKECLRMIQWTVTKLVGLGFDTELRKVGDQEINGKSVPVPPIILATLGYNPNRPTVLVYGHLDVKPASISDGWTTEPFFLTVKDNKLFGRGVSDDKGPILGWIHAIQAYQETSSEIPINIKFILETMLECGSEGLDELLVHLKDNFLANVDLVAISDSYWLSKSKPCITYGLRGLCYFFVEVECGSKDLHSGVFGGAVRDALPDLIWLLNQLVDEKGSIIIPGIMDSVSPVSPEEETLYDDIDFDIEDYKEDGGVRGLSHSDKKAILMARWRFPSLSFHGIQGACGDPGSKTVIPRKVIGKFSIRIVPNQKPERIDKLVRDFMAEKWAERGSPNKLECYMADDGLRPWCANPFHPTYRAAKQATAWAYEKVPDMIREGGTIERLLLLQELINKNVLLIPMGSCDDQPHSINEKLNLENYVTGTKLFAALIHEVGLLEKRDFDHKKYNI